MSARQKGNVFGFAVVAAALVACAIACFASCGALGWLGEPADGSKPASSSGGNASAPGATEQVTVHLPGGGLLMLPVAPSSPQTMEVPGLGTVTITPKASTPGTPTSSPGASSAGSAPGATNGDVVAQAGGGVVSVLTGNAMLGVLAAGALKALLSGIAAKKQSAAAAPA